MPPREWVASTPSTTQLSIDASRFFFARHRDSEFIADPLPQCGEGPRIVLRRTAKLAQRRCVAAVGEPPGGDVGQIGREDAARAQAGRHLLGRQAIGDLDAPLPGHLLIMYQ
jgi:hypothetical protein